ncbi:MAG: manganese efflux pump [Erysipelotrichaceae bacterium]|nr:manganese efflux pump [Erysipelotrichaceae bacterium]
MNVFIFVLNSMALGFGLAMDAFSVSLANGLHEPQMKLKRMFVIAGTFAFFQFLMPMLGWICVHTLLEYFNAFSKLIPYIALGLLAFIGGKMLIEGIKGEEGESEEVGKGALFVQGIATSIDALSVGFTIAHYQLLEALIASLIIGAVTLVICLAGLKIGRTFGMKLAGKASILGGVILIAIGLEIFITGVF